MENIEYSEEIQNDDLIESKLITDEEKEDLSASSSFIIDVYSEMSKMDVHGLVRRMDQDKIYIPRFGDSQDNTEISGFQRHYVWTAAQKDRFIESIYLGFPIPSVYLVNQDSPRKIVLDGQQRLMTLQSFLNDKHKIGKSSTIIEDLQNKKFSDLSDEVQSQIEDFTIPITTLTPSKETSQTKAIYQIFERLNSGGTQLTAHEIRVALYSGALAEKIEHLNNQPAWRNLYGKKNIRARDHELISRILAMYINYKKYSSPLKDFINDFYEENESEINNETNRAIDLFIETSEMLDASGISLKVYGYQINTAFTDALFVGLMNRLSKNKTINSIDLNDKVNKLRDELIRMNLVSGSTANEYNVRTRMETSISLFAQDDI